MINTLLIKSSLLQLCWQTGEVGALKKEMEKVKEEMQSMEYRVKWFQNKLKTELESHKVSTLMSSTGSRHREAVMFVV